MARNYLISSNVRLVYSHTQTIAKVCVVLSLLLQCQVSISFLGKAYKKKKQRRQIHTPTRIDELECVSISLLN